VSWRLERRRRKEKEQTIIQKGKVKGSKKS
jgi:hypothetical protein